MRVESECRNQKYDDHHCANRGLYSQGKAETTDDHQEGRAETKERRAPWKENARSSDGIVPAPDVAQPAYQHAPAKNGPKNRLG